MLSLSFYNTDDRRPQIVGVFYFYINQLDQDKMSKVFDIIHTEIYETYNDTGKIKVYETLPIIQDILGESGKVAIDLNLDYYGPDYSESILSEWETRKLVFHMTDILSPGINDYVMIEEEGSLSILYDMLQEFGMA